MRMRVCLLSTAVAVLYISLCGCSQKPAANSPAATAAQAAVPAKPELVPVDGVKWVTFSDPNEHAFTIDVPDGWKVDGGLVRRNSIDTSTFLRALSPDGAVMLMMGDPAPAFFHTPGFGAGPGAKPYLPGKDFARSHGESSLPALCSNVTFVSSADREDIATGPLSKAVPGSRYDAGEAFFSCTHNGQPTRAYMVAGTYLYASPLRNMPGMWGINLLDGCIAPADRLDQSRKMLLHMLLSARNDREWVKEQQARVDQATRNLNAITAAQQRAFESNLANAQAQQRAMTQQYNAFDQVLTQTGTFADASGNRYTLSNTQAYHWIGPGGKTMETNSANAPGAGWTQLHAVAPK
jgi:hypothetical protein